MSGLKLKARTATGLCDLMLSVLEAVVGGEMTPEAGGSAASVANNALRAQLGRIEYYRARGEKPSIPFFDV